jgi:hypothetical protein
MLDEEAIVFRYSVNWNPSWYCELPMRRVRKHNVLVVSDDVNSGSHAHMCLTIAHP